MGIKITTDDYGVKVWRSDKFGFPQYAIAISTKAEDGSRINKYKQLQFRKGVELQNGEEIYINDGFPTLSTWKDKHTGEEKYKEVWAVTDFSYRARYEQPDVPAPIQQAPQKPQPQIDMSELPYTFQAAEDDIPF